MSAERMTVSLEDFVKYLLKKWKMIGAIAVLSVLLFAVAAKLFGGKIVVEPSERYIELQEQKSAIEEYIEDSLFMEIDSMNIHERTLYVEGVSDREELKDFVVSGNVWGNMTQEIPSKYLTELVTWSDSEIVDAVELTVRCAEEETCKEYTEFMMEQLQNHDENLEITMGTARVISEEAVMKEQRRQYKLLDDINAELEYTAAGYTIEVSMTASIIMGVLAGGLLAVVILFFAFYVNDKIKK